MKKEATPDEEALKLSRREREILDAVYSLGQGTVTEVVQEMKDPPSRTAVRTFLRIMEEKGHLSHTTAGREFVYQPTRPRTRMGKSALRRVLEVFFDGSVEKALAAHLLDPNTELKQEDLDRLEDLITEIREKGN